MTTIRVKAGQPAFVHNRGLKIVKNTLFACDWRDAAVAFIQTGGDLVLENCGISGGHGPQIFGGNFQWLQGYTAGETKKYPAGYYGDLLRGMRAGSVTLKGLRFTHTCVGETMARAMGAKLVRLEDCELNNSGHPSKEVIQMRHVDQVQIIDCDLADSIVFGVLPAKDCKSAKEIAAYHGDAKARRIRAYIGGKSRIWGHVRVTGQADVVAEWTQMMAKDRRKDSRGRSISGDSAFMLTTIGGIAKPTLKVSNIRNVGGWPKIEPGAK